MSTATLVTCPACDGYGEITQCVNDGRTGCSHVNDHAYPCRDCNGEGEVPAYEPLPFWKPTDGDDTWHLTNPAPPASAQLTLLGTVVVCFALVAAFCALVAIGQRVICATHDNQLRYCSGYAAGEGTDR